VGRIKRVNDKSALIATIREAQEWFLESSDTLEVQCINHFGR
jgi:hypothetical protein